MIPTGVAVVTADAMRAAEEAVFAGGVSQIDLMERAGAAVAREALRFAMLRPVLVLAGPGNNGGDAHVVARLLAAAGLDVVVAAWGEPKPGVAAEMRARWTGRTVPIGKAEPRPVLIDGLLGIGKARPFAPDLAAQLKKLCDGAEFVLSIDIPSGFDTDSGDALGSPLHAHCTVALGALKPVHCIGEGREKSGAVLCADIGIPVESAWRSLTRPKLATPPPDANKYTRGLVVVIEGAMPGAARLCARASMASGAGYVVLTGSDPGEGPPDAIVRRRIGSQQALAALLDDDRIGAVVFGPGLGREGDAARWLDTVLACRHPLILDGDALSLLGESAARRVSDRGAATWLTPHSGEFERMFGAADESKIIRTLHAAKASGATILHKGADTVIAVPDGQAILSANASVWLSTAGTGDVLAGILAARIAAEPASPLDAAGAAVWLHGRAAHYCGPALHADRLIDALPIAIADCL
ncbi:NAD(P)H-hydrate dehydratase [Sphingosinithalassobacter portus]|uniref:NAD(P)H-hydrate dehydratase n=1 Tax=Stakelama portus TaxID=2676234 RepID=UPI000D6E943B|nr:NAD(P)H-hydrate dehydratase [Sphingosinithalassobacter portus]